LTGLDGTVTTGKVTKVQSPARWFPFLSELPWAGLRAQADKLGITLSQLQQLQFEKKMRLARKTRPGAPPGKDGPLGKVERS
jgi:hypothetical protein